MYEASDTPPDIIVLGSVNISAPISFILAVSPLPLANASNCVLAFSSIFCAKLFPDSFPGTVSVLVGLSIDPTSVPTLLPNPTSSPPNIPYLDPP